ncbi:radical SAM protein [Streptomyces sp. CC53]|nr:radical SAM protein [Streptomyces sp. CC53]
MTATDWEHAIDQLAAMRCDGVQFIGGEPCLHPALPRLIAHARTRGLGSVEVFSNLTHVPDHLWECFVAHRVDLATSYYSDQAHEHDAVTARRGSHKRTRANIARAQELGLNLRGGTVVVNDHQRAAQAHADLRTLGVTQLGADRMRAFGRGTSTPPTVNDLCGHCAQHKCAIGPDGSVWPCVLSRFITVGNVHSQPLADIWTGPALAAARAEITSTCGTAAGAQSCTPPQFLPMCGPCSPCVPSVGHCDPRAATTAPTTALPSTGHPQTR